VAAAAADGHGAARPALVSHYGEPTVNEKGGRAYGSEDRKTEAVPPGVRFDIAGI